MGGRLLVIASAIGIATALNAQAAPARDVCGAGPNPDFTIANCTTVIQTITAAVTLSGAYTNRGMAYQNKGLYVRAIADYDRAVALDPTNAVGFNDRCYAYGQMGNFDTALADCQTSLKLRPGHPEFLDSRAFIYLKMAKYKEAIRDYDQALRVTPIATSLYGRGIAKLKSGDRQGAALDLKAAKALDPNVVTDRAISGIVLHVEALSPGTSRPSLSATMR